MIRRPPRSTLSSSSAASDVYKRQVTMFALPQKRSKPLTGSEILQILAQKRYKTNVFSTNPPSWTPKTLQNKRFFQQIHPLEPSCPTLLPIHLQLKSHSQGQAQARGQGQGQALPGPGPGQGQGQAPPGPGPGPGPGSSSWPAHLRRHLLASQSHSHSQSQRVERFVSKAPS